MEHTATYVSVMKTSLERKKDYLSKILSLTMEQGRVAKTDPFSEEEFSKLVDEKEILIQNINEIDKGFESVYDRVRSEIRDRKEEFRDELLRIQKLIGECVDIGVEIETTEERNKQVLEQVFVSSYRGIRQVRQSKSVANKYYKSMSNSMIRDSFLYDKKK